MFSIPLRPFRQNTLLKHFQYTLLSYGKRQCNNIIVCRKNPLELTAMSGLQVIQRCRHQVRVPHGGSDELSGAALS